MSSTGAVLVLGLCLMSTVTADISYMCYANGTIVVTNPDPSNYRTAFANTTVAICTTSFNTDYSEVTVSSCDIEQWIFLVLSDRESGANDVVLGGGEKIWAYVVFCKDIEDGVTGQVVIGFTPRGDTHTDEPTVFPWFPLTSNIYTNEYANVSMNEAYTSEVMFWVITGIADYDLRPEDCIAYAGMSVNSSASHKALVENGCTFDMELVSDFAFVNGNGSQVFSKICGFRYLESSYITFYCRVRVCPKNSPACQINCDDSKRRRRREVTDDVTEMRTVVTTLYIQDNENKRFVLKTGNGNVEEIDLHNQDRGNKIDENIKVVLGGRQNAASALTGLTLRTITLIFFVGVISAI